MKATRKGSSWSAFGSISSSFPDLSYSNILGRPQQSGSGPYLQGPNCDCVLTLVFFFFAHRRRDQTRTGSAVPGDDQRWSVVQWWWSARPFHASSLASWILKDPQHHSILIIARITTRTATWFAWSDLKGLPCHRNPVNPIPRVSTGFVAMCGSHRQNSTSTAFTY